MNGHVVNITASVEERNEQFNALATEQQRAMLAEHALWLHDELASFHDAVNTSTRRTVQTVISRRDA